MAADIRDMKAIAKKLQKQMKEQHKLCQKLRKFARDDQGFLRQAEIVSEILTKENGTVSRMLMVMIRT